MQRLLVVASVLVVVMLPHSDLSAQAERVVLLGTLSEDAAQLLRRAPRLDIPGALQPGEFLDQARILQGFLGAGAAPRTEGEAIQFLLELAATRGPVFAEVTSSPPGLPVTYRIGYKPEASPTDPGTTTDNPRLRLEVPAWYWFRLVRDGEVEEKMVDCVNGCRVRFITDPGAR